MFRTAVTWRITTDASSGPISVPGSVMPSRVSVPETSPWSCEQVGAELERSRRGPGAGSPKPVRPARNACSAPRAASSESRVDPGKTRGRAVRHQCSRRRARSCRPMRPGSPARSRRRSPSPSPAGGCRSWCRCRPRARRRCRSATEPPPPASLPAPVPARARARAASGAAAARPPVSGIARGERASARDVEPAVRQRQPEVHDDGSLDDQQAAVAGRTSPSRPGTPRSWTGCPSALAGPARDRGRAAQASRTSRCSGVPLLLPLTEARAKFRPEFDDADADVQHRRELGGDVVAGQHDALGDLRRAGVAGRVRRCRC